MCDTERTTSNSNERETIFIGVAWPYANGFIHLGHVAGSLLSPDIFSRFHRMRGNRVLMVSGSDEHGTPITVRAESEGKSPQEVVDFFHEQTLRDLGSLMINFDLFTRTTHPRHYEVVQDLFLTLHSLGHIFPKTTTELFCEHCSKFLPDRYVNGICPSCGAEGARGDQCDSCSMTYNAIELIDPKCKICDQSPIPRETEHFFFRLSAFTDALLEFLDGKDHWKSRILNFTRNWVNKGLKDRPITRDISWGVPVPLDGYSSKRIYVWFDAVTGYLSASIQWAEARGSPDAWKEYWLDPATKSSYFLGKDNVPFHTIIWPSMLIGLSQGKGHHYCLPYNVPANEYLQLGGEKFTKSGGIGINVSSFMKEYTSDEVRYYLSIIMPENRDVDFDLLEFKTHINNELVATFGNFIHRVLSFTGSNFGSIPRRVVPNAKDDEALAEIEAAGDRITGYLAGCEFKNALKEIMALASYGNRYLVERAPWKLIKTDREDCGTVLNIGLRLVNALGVYTYPFLPESMSRLHALLGMTSPPSWDKACKDFTDDQYSLTLDRPNPLFRQLELTKEEKARVLASSQSQGKGKKRNGNKGNGKSASGNGKNGSGKNQGKSGDPVQPGGSKKKKKKKPSEPIREITLDDVLLKTGKVISVETHPDAEKLYVMSVDVGEKEPRTLIAGLRAHYQPEELAGNTLVIVCNLKPAMLRGILSQGMMLAASDSEHVRFLTPADPLSPGTRILGSDSIGLEPLAEITIEEFVSLPLEVRKVISSKEETITLDDGTTIAVGSGDSRPGADALVILCGKGMLHAGNVLVIPEQPVAPGATIR